MSIYTIVIICILFVIGVCFLLIRTSYLKNLNKALNRADFEKVQTLLQKPQAKSLLSTYLRDLYQARVYYLRKDEAALASHLRKMMNTSYSEEDKAQYLILYYHTFVEQGNSELASELLEHIHQLKDEKLIRYCDWTKAVLLEGRSDLCEEISTAIDNKDYYGFPLGVCAYLIGIQKKRMAINEDALLWLDTALDVLLDRDIYRFGVQREVDELHEMGYKSPEKPKRKKHKSA